jgi:formylglycine-generating enzyme required for sulfatase activity
MGAEPSEKFSTEPEWPQHSVEIEPFLIGKYPITQAQWQAISALPKVRRDLQVQPAHFKGEQHPVESVSWLDALEFCDRISNLTGVIYRLPSEAEWEYACRAGTITPFTYGNTLTDEVANYGSHTTYEQEPPDEYQPTTTSVGQHPPNAFGLYDMHGNVWEWCADQWHDSYHGAPATQDAWIGGGQTAWRSLRGGSWSDYPSRLRSAYRSGYPADALNRMIGFRVCSTFT